MWNTKRKIAHQQIQLEWGSAMKYEWSIFRGVALEKFGNYGKYTLNRKIVCRSLTENLFFFILEKNYFCFYFLQQIDFFFYHSKYALHIHKKEFLFGSKTLKIFFICFCCIWPLIRGQEKRTNAWMNKRRTKYENEMSSIKCFIRAKWLLYQSWRWLNMFQRKVQAFRWIFGST